VVSDCMRRIFYRLALAAVMVVGAAAPTMAKNIEVEPKTVMLFGDSIVAGYGLNATEVVTEKLQARLNAGSHAYVIQNAGVSGDTTAGGRSRIAWTVKRQKPDVVILALGGNDLLRGIAPAHTRENLVAILDELKARKVDVVLSAVQAPPSLGAVYADEFNAIYPALAKQYNIPLYPFLLEPVFGRKDLMQKDQIHPNAKGAEVIAEALASFLEKHYPNPVPAH
jgi:acyl-CoA thioesterase-1